MNLMYDLLTDYAVAFENKNKLLNGATFLFIDSFRLYVSENNPPDLITFYSKDKDRKLHHIVDLTLREKFEVTQAVNSYTVFRYANISNTIILYVVKSHSKFANYYDTKFCGTVINQSKL